MKGTAPGTENARAPGVPVQIRILPASEALPRRILVTPPATEMCKSDPLCNQVTWTWGPGDDAGVESMQIVFQKATDGGEGCLEPLYTIPATSNPRSLTALVDADHCADKSAWLYDIVAVCAPDPCPALRVDPGMIIKG